MVHALDRLRQCLRPGGQLLDLHPSGTPPLLGVRLGEAWHLAGQLDETDDFVEYLQAEAALAQALAQGWYREERQVEFEFLIHAETFAAMRDFLEAEWQDAVLDPVVGERVEALMATPGKDKEVIIRERARLRRLRLPGEETAPA